MFNESKWFTQDNFHIQTVRILSFDVKNSIQARNLQHMNEFRAKKCYLFELNFQIKKFGHTGSFTLKTPYFLLSQFHIHSTNATP